MKKYTKPVMVAEFISDVNEPVYMACSGKELFTANVASDYEHQVPETGRIDCRFQVDAAVADEPVFRHDGYVYIYYLFDQDIIVDRTSDFDILDTVALGDGHTLVIGRMSRTINQGEHIGFGDLFAKVIPDSSLNVHDPQVTIAFGYNPNGCF